MQNAENIAAEAGENRISVVSILVRSEYSRFQSRKCGTGKFRAFLLRRIYHRQNGYTV